MELPTSCGCIAVRLEGEERGFEGRAESEGREEGF
jgi:hypothetical protein